MYTRHKFTMLTIDQAPHFCEGCAFGKQHKALYSIANKKERSLIPKAFFHGDIYGPMQEESVGSVCYHLLFKDDYIGYKFVYCIKNKLETLSRFKTLIKTIHREIKCIIKTLRID